MEKKEIKKDCRYYYDLDLIEYKSIPYEEMLLLKVKAAQKLLHKLVRINKMEDHKRIQDVSKAVEFNTNLLLELGYDLGTVISKIRKFNFK